MKSYGSMFCRARFEGSIHCCSTSDSLAMSLAVEAQPSAMLGGRES